MTAHRLRSCLWATASVFTLGSVVLWVGVWWYPYETPGTEVGHTAISTDASEVHVAAFPPLSSFQSVWGLDLRRPLYDQPAAPVAAARRPAVKRGPPLRVKLAGTVVEPGRSMAMFITKAGKVELKAIGERVDGAEVLDITQENVSMRYSGRTVDLKLQKKGQP